MLIWDLGINLGIPLHLFKIEKTLYIEVKDILKHKAQCNQNTKCIRTTYWRLKLQEEVFVRVEKTDFYISLMVCELETYVNKSFSDQLEI